MNPHPHVRADACACLHSTRTRNNNSGFASIETVCGACGLGFDPDREQELRERDRAARGETRHTG
jgi:hypothetical protein